MKRSGQRNKATHPNKWTERKRTRKKEKLLETHVTQIGNCFLIFSMYLKSRLLSISQREWCGPFTIYGAKNSTAIDPDIRIK